MIRILVFFVLALACALGVLWLTSLSGNVSVNIANYQIEAKFGLIVALILALVVVSIIVWGIIKTIFQFPKITAQFFQKRKRDRGYSALSHGLISLGAGDEKIARKYGLIAERILNNEPAVQLLLAQTAQMSGNKEETRNRFEAMTQQKETRLLGLHGLYIEATRHNEPEAAQHYAEEAVSLSPNLPWAANAELNIRIANQNWQKAIQSLERNYRLKLITKQKYHRQKAVMLTALAMEMEQGEPEQAKSLAIEAHGLDKSLIPAAVLLGRLHTRRGDIRKAAKVLENSWRISPHPEIAQAYAHARSGDSVQNRWNRAKELAKIHPNHIESILMLAQVGLEAQKFDEARTQLEKALKKDPTKRAFLLMAKLEEMENADQGLARRWLSNAINAPKDFAWVADGVEYEFWAPISPISKNLDAFRWEKPKHSIQSHFYEIGKFHDKFEDLQGDANELLSNDPAQEIAEQIEKKEMDQNEPNQEIGTDTEARENVEPDSITNVEQSKSEEVNAAEETVKVDSDKESEKLSDKVAKTDSESEHEKEEEIVEASKDKEIDDKKDSKPASNETETKKSADSKKSPKSVDFPLKHAPDDPGPSEGDDLPS